MDEEVKEENKFDIKIFNKEALDLIVTSIIATTLFGVMNIFFNIFSSGIYYTDDYSYRFSVLMGIIVYTFFLAIFKKASRTTIVCYLLIYLLSIAMELKLMYTGEPIYFSDVKFLNQVGDLWNLAITNLSPQIFFRLFCGFSIYGIALFALFLLNCKYNIEVKSKKIRIGMILIDILLIIVLFIPNKYTKEIYLKIFFNSEEYVDYASYTNNYNYYLKVGAINGMYGTVLNNRFSPPKNYEEENLNEIINNTENNSSKELGKPNIIVVFSESFFNIDQLEEIKFNRKITENFNKLKNEGKVINLISPAYGGMSENVAFELFTGGSMNYFPKGYIPIMSLYSRKNSVTMPSIVKVLGENGYRSKIVFGKDFYNSKDAFLKIGFNEYKDLSETMDIEKITDEYGINTIIKELENKKDSEKLFYTLETFEAHMPYSENKYDNYDISILESNLDQEENITVRAYCQAIYNVDKELNRLYEYIKTYDEPTVVLFLGDHLPYLYTKNNNNVIDKLKYFNTDDELLNYYRKYNTQCLILSNFNMDKVDVPEYLGVDLIFSNLLNQMDIKNTDYYRWLDSTKNILPASNRYISLDREGKMYYTKDLKNEMKDMYDLKDKMQYKYFKK